MLTSVKLKSGNTLFKKGLLSITKCFACRNSIDSYQTVLAKVKLFTG